MYLAKGRGTPLGVPSQMITYFDVGIRVTIPKVPGRYAKGLHSFGGSCGTEGRVGPIGVVKLDYEPKRTSFPMLILACPDNPDQHQHLNPTDLHVFQQLFSELPLHRMYIRVSENSIQKPPTPNNCDYIYRSETRTITAKHDCPAQEWQTLFQSIN
jgi:hypothetical protein